MILGIHHTTFLSNDLPKTRAFYEGVLGLKVSQLRPQMSFEGVWYEVAPNQQIHIMLLANPEAGLQRPLHGGRDRHVALIVSDLEKLANSLNKANIAFTQSMSGRRAIFCRDPDGNALEFIEA